MLLRTEHLTKDYGQFRALDDLNLSVAPGEVVGLLGPNGSGKTTALRLILGFLRPTAGAAWIDDHDCWYDSVAARSKVAYLPGELRLYENMTGRQLVTFLERLRGQPLTRVAELARRFDIDLDRPIAHLSSGMKRKAALLQVLLPHAPLLILDEPTNTLDPTMRDELLAQLRLARDDGQAVLFSSHVLTEVEAVCDRVAILQRGRLVHLQPMGELRQGRTIRVRFDGVVHYFKKEPDGGDLLVRDRTPDRSHLLLLPGLPGLQLRSVQADEVTLEHTGSLPPLLEWLATQPVRELRVEPLGLSAVYHRYHGPVEGG
jgi:ABC-2 type transport system ATP-binding protein